MKSKLFVVLALMGSLFILSGCSQDDQADRASTEKPSPEAQAPAAGSPQSEQTTFGLTEEGMNADKRVGSQLGDK